MTVLYGFPAEPGQKNFSPPAAREEGGNAQRGVVGEKGDIRWQQSTEKLNLMGSALVLFLLSAPRECALSN